MITAKIIIKSQQHYYDVFSILEELGYRLPDVDYDNQYAIVIYESGKSFIQKYKDYKYGNYDLYPFPLITLGHLKSFVNNSGSISHRASEVIGEDSNGKMYYFVNAKSAATWCGIQNPCNIYRVIKNGGTAYGYKWSKKTRRYNLLKKKYVNKRSKGVLSSKL